MVRFYAKNSLQGLLIVFIKMSDRRLKFINIHNFHYVLMRFVLSLFC